MTTRPGKSQGVHMVKVENLGPQLKVHDLVLGALAMGVIVQFGGSI